MLAGLFDPQGRLDAAERGHRIGRARRLVPIGPERASGALVVAGEPAPALRDDGLLVAASLDFVDREAAHRSMIAGLRGDLTGLDRLRGDFAGCAWDPRHGAGLLVRDHFGRRGLFHAESSGVLHFATEIALVLAMLPRRPAVDSDAIALWLAREPLGVRRTHFDGVEALAPGHVLRFGSAREEVAYWRPTPRELRSATAEEAADEVWAGLRRVVRFRNGASPGAAVLLSGGLDSGAVLAAAAELAREAGGTPPPAFTATFPDHPEVDESRYTAVVATALGSHLTRLEVRPQSILAGAWAFQEAWEVPQPFPNRSLFHPMRVAAGAAAPGAVMDGEGGDELFGSEPLLVGDLLRGGRPRAAWQLTRTIPGMGERPSRAALGVVGRRWVLPAVLPLGLEQQLRRWTGRREHLPELLLPAVRERVRMLTALPAWRADTRSGAWRAHKRHVLVERPAEAGAADYLRRNAAMAGALGTSPLRDPDLVELALGLPPHLAFDRLADKQLLRRALRNRLPDEVRLRRDKTVFNAIPLASLVEYDQAELRALLTGPLEVACWVDPARLTAMIEGGRPQNRRSAGGWLGELWRAATAETFLRREADR